MKIYNAGESVPYGVYFSGRPLDIHIVTAEGDALEGKPGVAYRRMPTLIAVAAGPVIGGVFVMAFPVVIFAALVLAVTRMPLGMMQRTASRNAHLAAVRWEPSSAYLNMGDRRVPLAIEELDELDILAAEVGERRLREEGL